MNLFRWRVRAWVWKPTLQPVYHPSDKDPSLGTPVWRPALHSIAYILIRSES